MFLDSNSTLSKSKDESLLNIPPSSNESVLFLNFLKICQSFRHPSKAVQESVLGIVNSLHNHIECLFQEKKSSNDNDGNEATVPDNEKRAMVISLSNSSVNDKETVENIKNEKSSEALPSVTPADDKDQRLSQEGVEDGKESSKALLSVTPADDKIHTLSQHDVEGSRESSEALPSVTPADDKIPTLSLGDVKDSKKSQITSPSVTL